MRMKVKETDLVSKQDVESLNSSGCRGNRASATCAESHHGRDEASRRQHGANKDKSSQVK